MYEFIKGRVAEANPAYIIIETGGVGYLINVSVNTYSKVISLSEVMLYLHQIVRDDAHLLYGFYSKEERALFRLLISISGIGATTANVMLSSMSVDEIIKAIITEDVNTIRSIKGIGIKTAQRVIIELKDKVDKDVVISDPTSSISSLHIKDEAMSALVMLGFMRTKVSKTLDNILKTESISSVEELIKLALKQL